VTISADMESPPAAISRARGERIFSPLVTLWASLGQVLSPDHSCRAAVARLITHRVARGKPAATRASQAMALVTAGQGLGAS
jgi:hypothetical protein